MTAKKRLETIKKLTQSKIDHTTGDYEFVFDVIPFLHYRSLLLDFAGKPGQFSEALLYKSLTSAKHKGDDLCHPNKMDAIIVGGRHRSVIPPEVIAELPEEIQMEIWNKAAEIHSMTRVQEKN